MNKKAIFPLALVLILMLACQTITGASQSAVPTATSGASLELAATMTALAGQAVEAVQQATQVSPLATSQAAPPTEAPALVVEASPTVQVLAPTQVDILGLDITFSVQDPPMIDERVALIKTTLHSLGYEVCAVAYEDFSSFYTAQTASAVSQFQAINGLAVDGMVGPETWSALMGASPLPAPETWVQEYEVAESFGVNSGVSDLAAINGQLWALTEGFNFVEVFDPNSEEIYAGIYSLVSWPGEEDYAPMALATDGQWLWVAFQGVDGMVQAYDVASANPVEGLLQPVLQQSIHFDSFYIRGMVHDGVRVWVSIEDTIGPGLVSIDPLKATAQVFMLPYENYPAAAAFDTNSKMLWVPVEGMLGDHAILAVDPRDGLTGEVLGVCGFQAVFTGDLLWVVKSDRLVGVDPTSRAIKAVAHLEGHSYIPAIAFDGKHLWVLDQEYGMLLYVRVK